MDGPDDDLGRPPFRTPARMVEDDEREYVRQWLDYYLDKVPKYLPCS